MQTVTSVQMQALEREAMNADGITVEVLMERAGFGVADGVRHLADANGYDAPRVSLFAGRGNNGGDALVAARVLHESGLSVEVLVAGREAEVRGAAGSALQALRQAGVRPEFFDTVRDWEGLMASDSLGADILVDGLLGTGISGPARGPVAAAIQVINRFSDRALVLAIDVPSGLNADSGVADGDVVSADLTLAMGLPKAGLLSPGALPYVGTVDVVDIGIRPPPAEDAPDDAPTLISASDIAGVLPRRRRESHKGDYGHVLIVAGATGYPGAVALATMAACRSGVGRVTVVTPADPALTVAALAPEAMVRRGAENDTGSLASTALDEGSGVALERFSAVLVGPGMTPHPDGGSLLQTVLRSSVPTVILDADALNLAAAFPGLLENRRPGVILTPHPGEMARLAGIPPAAVQADRWAVARAQARRTGATVVLKGAGTVVCEGQRLAVNLTGNPGMATGGMGDVLAGFMAGLAAQGLSPFDAARAAVYLHGCAGDDVARMHAQAGLTATDVIHALPRMFRRVQGR